jgi:predicted RNase H-like HicB family nuclease
VDLRELLSIPYLLEAEAVETDAGKWLVHLDYPELPGCTAEGYVVEDVLRELEQRRIEIIVGLVEQGRNRPFPASRSQHPIRYGRFVTSDCRVGSLRSLRARSRLAECTARFDGERRCCRTKTMSDW